MAVFSKSYSKDLKDIKNEELLKKEESVTKSEYNELKKDTFVQKIKDIAINCNLDTQHHIVNDLIDILCTAKEMLFNNPVNSNDINDSLKSLNFIEVSYDLLLEDINNHKIKHIASPTSTNLTDHVNQNRQRIA